MISLEDLSPDVRLLASVVASEIGNLGQLDDPVVANLFFALLMRLDGSSKGAQNAAAKALTALLEEEVGGQ